MNNKYSNDKENTHNHLSKNPRIGRKRLWWHGWIGGLLIGSAKEVGLGF
jgi:hypothetical protein